MKRHWSKYVCCARNQKVIFGNFSSIFNWMTYWKGIRLLLILFSLSRQNPEFWVQLSYKQYLLHIILPLQVAKSYV
jgi:hypothetical protein